MPNTTIRDLAPGAAVSDGDLLITRQGADTVDKSITALQLKEYAGGGAAGSDGQIQFNDGGAFAGDPGLIFDKSSTTLSVTDGTNSVSIAPGSGVDMVDGANSKAMITAGGAVLKAQTGKSVTFSPNEIDLLNDANQGLIVTVSNTNTFNGSLYLPDLTDSRQYDLPDASGVLVVDTQLADYVIGPASSTDNAIARYHLATGKIIQDSNLIITDAGSLGFTGQATPSYAQGQMAYDTSNEALTFFNNNANVALQIGQEEWIRVVNNTGVTIANGAAVYINGASGGLPTIALAQANAAATTVGVGLVTASIPNGGIGYVTSLGLVRGLDTSAFSVGAVFISAAVAGALTQTAPLAPNYRYRVGFVTSVNATTGTIHVTPSTAALGNGTANQLFGMNTAGTAQETKSLVAGTNITITPGAGTLTIDATGGGSGITQGQMQAAIIGMT